MKHLCAKYVKLCIRYILGFVHFLEYNLYCLMGLKENYLNKPYYRLWTISYISEKTFREIRELIESVATRKLKEKKRMSVAFILYTGSMWSIDELYKKMVSDDRFEVDIIIGKHKKSTSESQERNYISTKKFIENDMGYKTREVSDTEDMSKYDLIFYLTQFNLKEKYLNVVNLPMKKLICYSCYGFMLLERTEKMELPMYYLSWRFFCDSKFYIKYVKENLRIFPDNFYFYGYSKMDTFYAIDKNEKPNCNKKVIIYAPHHSVNSLTNTSATFKENYLFFLELARKYSDVTYWYVKPHPLLRDHAIDAGMFKNQQEYDTYLEQWNSLENARVIEDGGYSDIFKESSAMITDSISFLAEYQYTHKPLLFLNGDGDKFNEFGKKILDILYQCSGNSFERIEKFVHLVLEGKDEMYDKRKEFFDRELDYRGQDGKLSCERIYDEITQLID